MMLTSLRRLFHQPAAIQTVYGVRCFVAGTMVKPVAAQTDAWLPRAEAFTQVRIDGRHYHPEGCRHWRALEHAPSSFAMLVDATALGLRPCR